MSLLFWMLGLIPRSLRHWDKWSHEREYLSVSAIEIWIINEGTSKWDDTNTHPVIARWKLCNCVHSLLYQTCTVCIHNWFTVRVYYFTNPLKTGDISNVYVVQLCMYCRGWALFCEWAFFRDYGTYWKQEWITSSACWIQRYTRTPFFLKCFLFHRWCHDKM